MNSTGTYTPQSDNVKSHKKMILFVVLGLALAIGFGLMTYSILVSPQRQPYRDALAQYQNVYNANIAVITAGSSLDSSSATDESFTSSLQIVSNTLDALELETEQLGTQSVLKNGEGKTLYDTLDKKITTYIAYNRDIVASLEIVRPVIYACSQTMANVEETEEGAAATRQCATNLQAISDDIPDADYTQLVNSSYDIYMDIAETISQRAALADPDGADATTDSELADTQDDLISSLSTTSTTFSDNLSEHKEAVDITEAAQALDNYLTSKSSVF